MPAEWEPHVATWLGWPHNESDWPGKLPAIQWVYAEIVRKLVTGELVRILVNSRSHQITVRETLLSSGVNLKRVQFYRFPTNRGWTRDFGPIFVTNASRRPPRSKDLSSTAIMRFHFNAWAHYPDWQRDNKIPELAARALKMKLLAALANGRPFVLEGGSIDVNGRGTLLTSEECLLDQKVQVRNPGLGRKDVEIALKAHLGVTNILWLGRGIAGDDTHGHVDDFCRFTGPRTIVLAEERNAGDVNHRALEQNRERLEAMRLEDGSRIDLVRLPMPAALSFRGVRLPASYANFYISNAAVLVPTFNDPRDRQALGILAELFPDRPVVGIHAVDLVWGFGTLHCLTQQQPAW